MPKPLHCKSKACSAYTSDKQANLIRFIDVYVKNYTHSPILEWVEATAGSGENDVELADGTSMKVLGSPVIAHQRITTLRPDLNLHMTLVEADYDRFCALEKNMKVACPDEELYAIACSNNKTLGRIVKKYSQHGRGIAYYDPEGCTEFVGLLDLLERYDNFDILCHMSAQSYKRTTRRITQNIDENYQMSPQEFIAQAKKKYNYISNPTAKLSWYFMFCTNTPDAINGSEHNFLVDVNTSMGASRLNIAMVTNKEKEAAKDQRMRELEARLVALGEKV